MFTERLDVLQNVANRVGTNYVPGCLTTCGNARFCRDRAVKAESPCMSGTAAARLLPEVHKLGRAESLTRGAKPTAAERPAATLLERAVRKVAGTLSRRAGTLAASANRVRLPPCGRHTECAECACYFLPVRRTA